MAYTGSGNLPFEAASKLGHLSVVNDPFIKQMLESFEKGPITKFDGDEQVCTLDLSEVKPLDFVITVDGSLSTIPNSLAPHKMLSYIKIAALNISLAELDEVQAPIVNPEAVSKILSDHAHTESTVLPLSNVHVAGMDMYQSIRHAVEATFQKILDGGAYDTLRFLVSQEWDKDAEAWKSGSPNRPYFFCPSCGEKVVFPRSTLRFNCNSCQEELTLADYLGLLMDVNESSNDSAVAMNLMGVLEHLTLFNFLRQIVGHGKRSISRVLLLKDGPLMLRGQYSRLIDPIREYLHYLKKRGIECFIAGVEKDGAFAEHIEELKHWYKAPKTAFLPSNKYILERIKHSGSENTAYGERVLYGSKLYYRVDDRNVLVLNIPNYKNSFDTYDPNPQLSDLIGYERIIATLERLVSRQYQHAVLPIVAANRIASMSFYPSNNILERFTEAHLGDDTGSSDDEG